LTALIIQVLNIMLHIPEYLDQGNTKFASFVGGPTAEIESFQFHVRPLSAFLSLEN